MTKNNKKRVIEPDQELNYALGMLNMISKNQGPLVRKKWGEDRLEILRASGFLETRNIMRPTFISYYLAIRDIKIVGKIIGHSEKSETIDKHYKAIDLYEENGQLRPLMKKDAEDYFNMLAEVKSVLAKSLNVGELNFENKPSSGLLE